MYAPKFAAHLKSRTVGKWYEKNLGDYVKLCVQEKKLLEEGYALMPFHAKRSAEVADIDG